MNIQTEMNKPLTQTEIEEAMRMRGYKEKIQRHYLGYRIGEFACLLNEGPIVLSDDEVRAIMLPDEKAVWVRNEDGDFHSLRLVKAVPKDETSRKVKASIQEW